MTSKTREFYESNKKNTKFQIGIYGIFCLQNEDVYIGKSKHIPTRFIEHRKFLKNGYHKNPHMQNVYNKHGKENFAFFYIEECKMEELTDRELHYYNLMEGPNRLNITHPLECPSKNPLVAKKISLTTKGKKTVSSEARSKISVSLKEFYLTKEGIKLKQHLKIINIGKTASEETKKKLAIATKKNKSGVGYKLTEFAVVEIKKLILKKIKDSEIAEKYSVTRETIRNIRLGTQWSHITNFKRHELRIVSTQPSAPSPQMSMPGKTVS